MKAGVRPRNVPPWLWIRGLSVACLALYAISQVGAAIALWFEFVDEQRQHQQAVDAFTPSGYVWPLLEQTLQNWQSEFLALGVLIALTSVLLHRGSKHSRDGQDEVLRRIKTIRRRVAALDVADA